MFGQSNDQQSHDDQNNLNNFFDTNTPFGAPAPGAPVGPLTGADGSAPAPAPATQMDDTTSATPVVDANHDELLDIKQGALQELTPLVGHLEQSPEEKFKTTMMMIQATDDHTLIKSAYDSAKQITDEKTRAQALLDVVNEINYFTQHHQS